VIRWVALFLLAAIGCGKSTRSSTSASDETQADPDTGVSPMDARESTQWAAAAQGDPEELMRVADLVGCEGLRDRASQVELRATAIRAMQYCSDYSELPWLAELANGKNDSEARAALEVIDELAARPRRATDPEDAEELHVGCGALLSIARSTSQPKPRRVLAVRALRMLSERGCVRRADIPTDLDAK
jgi:hypothetical protein